MKSAFGRVSQPAQTTAEVVWAALPALLLAALASALLSLSALATPASAAIPFCPHGSGPGQCSNPQGLATDWETGHVYVADRGNGRINAFQSDGTFLSSFGQAQLDTPTWVAVDNDPASPSHHDVYVASENFEVQKFKASGEFVKSFGGKGEGTCQLTATEDSITVGPGGVVNVADSYDKDGNDGPLHIFVNRVQQFDSEGDCMGEVELFDGEVERVRNIAVDSIGNFYVTVAGAGGVIRKYSLAGTFVANLGGQETQGLAVDAADNVFGKQRGVTFDATASTIFIAEYAADTSPVRRFAYEVTPGKIIPGLAASGEKSGAEGVFATEGIEGVNFLNASKGPVILPQPCHVKPGALGSVKATLQTEVNPEGEETTLHVEYSDGTEAKSSPPEVLGGPADFELHEAALTITGLKPEATYHCTVVAENADGEAAGEEGSFETKEGFEFGPSLISDVGTEEATVNAQGNPLGLPATATIEYVTDAQYQLTGFDEALSAPAEEELDYGASETMQLRSAVLTGLAPSTTYHWRLHVRNGVPPEGLVCPRGAEEPCPTNEHLFRTFDSPGATLPDGRAWELVSPGQKNGAEVGTPKRSSGIFEENSNVRILASSGSGEAVTYTSFTSFGKDSEGGPATSQYLSKRTLGGWVTQNISPFGFQTPVLAIPFKGFTPELSFTAFKVSEGVLAPGCPPGVENLYLRDNTTGARTCLTPEVPQAGDISALVYAGSSEDGSRAFFASGPRYAGVPAGKGFSLYEWSAAGGLKPVSVLPGQSEPAAPTGGTAFGPSLGIDTTTNYQWGQTVMRHVVSADGSKAFWTYVPEDEPRLLLARVNGAETIQLDAKPATQKEKGKQPGAGPYGNGVFRAASKDGSVVYFTAPGKLISGSKAEAGKPDLYRYELGTAEPLSDLTRGLFPGDVQGVIGASDDGSYLYFVAKSALSGEEEGPTGEKAVEGAFNLYLFHAGKTSFIARLSAEDQYDWTSQPKLQSARVSPDGTHLVFLSRESKALAGYDNTIAQGQHCQFEAAAPDLKNELLGGPLCQQGFLYDAEAETLDCATCNPTGARPLGPALVPGWGNVYEGPRYLSDDGSRFFFESLDALALADENERRDVYEFERPGTGSCATESDAYDPAAGGCHFLLSSGQSEDESYFIDASSNGRDAFFSTRSALVGWDPNDNYDVYDARAGGGFPEPSQAPNCQGEGCKAPASAPAPSSSPATPGFFGPEDSKHKKPKPHHKKKHRKAKKKPHSHKKGTRR